MNKESIMSLKRIISFIVLIFILVTSLYSQWYQYRPGPTMLYDILSVPNDSVFWATKFGVTDFSITTDGGLSWTNKKLSSDLSGATISGLCAMDPNTACLIISKGDKKGLYKTTDQGKTWIRYNIFNSLTAFPDIVYFWNLNDGVAIGDAYPNQNFEIYTTNNGGNTWNAVSSNNMPVGDYDGTYNGNKYYKTHGDTIYFSTGFGKIFKSTNKGYSWTKIATPFSDGTNISFDFKNENNGLLINENTATYEFTFYSTSDKGQTWTKLTRPSLYYYQIKYLRALNLYLNFDKVYGLQYSKDDGKSWQVIGSFVNNGAAAVAEPPSGKLVLSGESLIYSTTDFSKYNLSIAGLTITGDKTFDITFSTNIEINSAQNKSNYMLYRSYVSDSTLINRGIESISVDSTDKKIVHFKTYSSLPNGLISVHVMNVFDESGYPLLENKIATVSKLKTDVSTVEISNELLIYPNPVGDIITICNNYTDLDINIFDVCGKSVLSGHISDNKQISVSNLLPGLYVIRAQNKYKTLYSSFIKK